MKVRIELEDGLQEDEVIIRCRTVSEAVTRIHQFVAEQGNEKSGLTFYKDNEEYYFPLEDVLFFETENEVVWAHTTNDAYRTRMRLYELEELLPRYFVRAAKSTIVNTRQVYYIKRDITSSSLVQFNKTHKHVYASRRYYPALKEKMNERNNHE